MTAALGCGNLLRSCHGNPGPALRHRDFLGEIVRPAMLFQSGYHANQRLQA